VPVIITGRHRPHEVLFLAFSALVGLAFVAGAKPPTTLERLLPLWVLWTWYLLLLASGLIGLASFTLVDPYRALVLERAAMYGQVAAPTLYGVALIGTRQAAAMFVAAFVLTLAVASAWRGWQVSRGIRALRQAGEGR
jgi:hypothetical protein